MEHTVFKDLHTFRHSGLDLESHEHTQKQEILNQVQDDGVVFRVTIPRHSGLDPESHEHKQKQEILNQVQDDDVQVHGDEMIKYQGIL